MIEVNPSLKILKSKDLGSDNGIRCFGSDLANIIRVPSKLNVLNSKGAAGIPVLDHPTQTSLTKQSVPGFSTISLAENGYKTQILNNLIDQQIIYQTISFPKQRKVIINHIVLLQIKMGLCIESLHLSVVLLNRCMPFFMEKGNFDFELLSITCLWIASKIEETRVQGIKYWVEFGKGFEESDLTSTEQQILKVLEYETIVPTPYSFLQVFLDLLNIQKCSKQGLLSQYIIQLSLFHPQLLKFSDSVLAISCIYLSLKVLNFQWEEKLVEDLISIQVSKVRGCARQLCKILQIDNKQRKSSVYRKYKLKKYQGISDINLGRRSEFTN